MTEDDFAAIGVIGLILLMIVAHFSSRKKGTMDYLMIFILLFTVAPTVGIPLREIIYEGSWATIETRIFLCAAAAYVPGVLALRLVIRIMMFGRAENETEESTP